MVSKEISNFEPARQTLYYSRRAMTLHNIEEEEAVKELVSILDQTLSVSAKINEVIGRLSEKRVTLEEKMIRSYFHTLSAELFSINSYIHQAMADIYQPKNISESERSLKASERSARITSGLVALSGQLAALKTLLSGLTAQLDQLIKVLTFNLNFTEQYFEHGFYAHITNDENFLAQISDFKNLLKTNCN